MHRTEVVEDDDEDGGGEEEEVKAEYDRQWDDIKNHNTGILT